MKRLALIVFVLGIMFMNTACFSLNWAHNKRHVKKFFDELSLLHEDLDRVIFGMERNPAE